MAGTTLGLDLGPNSIGWALIDEEMGRIVATGVRVFPAGVDNFDTKKEKPKNESRRIARGMRRQIARRARRKRQLRALLESRGLLPVDAGERDVLFRTDPYGLRARALGERLSLSEMGRVLLHLCQRRGFLSNRRSDRERKAETKGMLAEISELAQAIATGGHETLGAHLASLRGDGRPRIRGRHTRRDMYEYEFQRIWKEQTPHFPDVLTEELRQKVHRLIFFQRRMYWPKSVIGRCELEPKEPRCPRADRLAQRFRLLQEVNNLKYQDPDTGAECRVADNPEQYELLLDKLSATKEMTFDQIRKALGFLESVQFNLEKGKRSKLKGMVTDAILAGTKLFGKSWYKRPEAERDEIVRALIDQDEAHVLRLATERWGLDPEAADRLLDVDLPPGYLHLSRKALEKLLPPMRRGLLYMTDDDRPSALSEAGYVRPDQRRSRVYDFLPEPPTLTNPIVRQALFEVRKVVNAIIREYGKPATIHIELARDAKATSEERKRINQQMRDREALRDDAAEKIRAHGIKVTRDAIDRYLLWQEQKSLCPYSGEIISVAQLFGGEVDVDHILPFSRSLDDSMANKVVCFRRSNADKGNKTPYEWLANTQPERFEQVRQRVSALPYNKRKRFTQKTLNLDDFVARQLNDTRYISRAVLEYVRSLYDQPHLIFCIKGQQTAALRWQWGLNTILRIDDANLKNRDDHRHHAVDAVVIALTDQKRLRELASIERRGGTETHGEVMLDPWEHFREDAEQAVNAINVSHRVSRKVGGALHEDTFYGATDTAGVFVVRKPIESLSLAMVDDICDPRVKQLVIERLKTKNVEFGRGKKRELSPADWKALWKEPLLLTAKRQDDSDTPAALRKRRQRESRKRRRNRILAPAVIHKVRVFKRDLTIAPLRDGSTNVKPGSTHHMCIFEWQEGGKTKRDAVFVTMLEATQRLKEQHRRVGAARRELAASGLSADEQQRRFREIRKRIVTEETPLINRKHPDRPDANFLMSLSPGELVLGTFKGKERLACYKTGASTTKQLSFAPHTDARKGDDAEKLSANPSTLNAHKVTVDPLGRIRWAND